VSPLEDKRVCYVVQGGRLEQREVEIGEFNDEFIEIKKGIRDGEKVCLRAPGGLANEAGGKKPLPGKELPKPANKGAVTAAVVGGTTPK